MKTKIEKNMDDFVYEDAYYDDVLKNNESINEQSDENNDNEDDLPVELIVVCEDCTHQWDGTTSSSEDNTFCPLCGSSSVVTF